MQFRGVILLAITFVAFSCSKRAVYITNSGQVYGTLYHIVYESPGGEDFHQAIDKKFREYTMIFSTFEKESVISKINNNEPVVPDKYFITCFKRSQEISAITGGAFDITVAPMVNAWGFGFKNKQKITPGLIDSLKAITGYKTVKLVNGQIVKQHPNTMLDMSAISKGYTSDLIGDFLASEGCENYMVEIGGEVVAKGVNSRGTTWSIGISKPNEDAMYDSEDINAVVHLDGKGLATSGNYRNFYVENGVKYAHTIDPKTGYPVQHSLLSSTVMANDCMTADGFATAFMVLGLKKSIKLANSIPDIAVYFIYADSTGNNQVYCSDNFKPYLEK